MFLAQLSRKLEDQVSFSDHMLFVVCSFVILSVCKLFSYSISSPEPLGHF